MPKKENKKKSELEIELEDCQKKRDEYLAGWQRARADFINYKKEETEKLGALLGYALEELILKFLPILDSLDLAEKNLPEDLEDNEYIKGLLQNKAQIQDILKNFGIEEIKTLGEKFNPNYHEVTEELEAEGKESGIIIEEVQKGYNLQSRVIRPAKVKVVK